MRMMREEARKVKEMVYKQAERVETANPVWLGKGNWFWEDSKTQTLQNSFLKSYYPARYSVDGYCLSVLLLPTDS